MAWYWWIIIIVGFFIIREIFRFAKNIQYDVPESEFKNTFKTLIDGLNLVAFDGKGTIKKRGNTEFSLYDGSSNNYLIFRVFVPDKKIWVDWKMKFLQVEMVYSKTIEQYDSVTEEMWLAIFRRIILEFIEKKIEHVKKVEKNTMFEKDANQYKIMYLEMKYGVELGNLAFIEQKLGSQAKSSNIYKVTKQSLEQLEREMA